MDLWKIWMMVRRQQTAGVLVLLAMLAGLLVMSQVRPGRYRSSADIIINPHTVVVDNHLQGTDMSDWRTDFVTLTTFMQSDLFLTRVIHRSGLSLDPLQVRGMLTFNQLAGGQGATSIVAVDATSTDATVSQRIAQAFVDEFVAYVPVFSSVTASRDAAFLKGMVSDAEDALHRAEDGEMAWQEHKRVLSMGTASTNYQGTLAALTTQVNSARKEVDAQETNLQEIQAYISGGQFPNHPSWETIGSHSSEVPHLQTALAQEKETLAKMLGAYQPNDPGVLKQADVVRHAQALLDREKALDARSMLSFASAGLQRARAREQDTQDALARFRARWTLPRNNVEYERLSRDVLDLRSNYDNLETQYQNALIAEQKAHQEGSIQILLAPGPAVRVPRIIDADLAASLPLILAISVAMALLAMATLDTVANVMAVRPRMQATMGLPVLGEIPVAPRRISRRWQTLRAQVQSRGQVAAAARPASLATRPEESPV